MTVVLFLDTRERWSQGDPWQQCIYLRVCLFVKKKCPSLPGFLTSDTPLVSHSRMAIMLELKTLEILVLSILVSANSSRLVNRLKLVLSPNPRRYYHRLGSSNIHNFDSYSHISKPLDVRPSSQIAWNALIFDSCAWYWWPFLLKCVSVYCSPQRAISNSWRELAVQPECHKNQSYYTKQKSSNFDPN